jgi:hypothetical protein
MIGAQSTLVRPTDLAADLPDGSVLVVDAAKDAAGNAVRRLTVAAVRRDPGRVNAPFVAIRRAAEQRRAARDGSGRSPERVVGSAFRRSGRATPQLWTSRLGSANASALCRRHQS